MEKNASEGYKYGLLSASTMAKTSVIWKKERRPSHSCRGHNWWCCALFTFMFNLLFCANDLALYETFWSYTNTYSIQLSVSSASLGKFLKVQISATKGIICLSQSWKHLKNQNPPSPQHFYRNDNAHIYVGVLLNMDGLLYIRNHLFFKKISDRYLIWVRQLQEITSCELIYGSPPSRRYCSS